MIRKALLAVVIVVGALLLLFVLLLVAYGLYSAYANDKADAAAKTFCSSIRTGSPIDAVIKKAERSEQKSRLFSNDGEYRFSFSGAIFHASACTVKTEAGKVVSTELVVYDD